MVNLSTSWVMRATRDAHDPSRCHDLPDPVVERGDTGRPPGDTGLPPDQRLVHGVGNDLADRSPPQAPGAPGPIALDPLPGKAPLTARLDGCTPLSPRAGMLPGADCAHAS